MYKEFYKLKENPFNVTADPFFFYSSRSHSEAFSSLFYGIMQRKGIMVVTGEVGTGKSTICRKLLYHGGKNLKFAYIINHNFAELELLQLIIQDLGIWTRERDKYGLINILNRYLIKQSKKDHNVVLLIDEAQNLSIGQLEQIRLLSNLETEKEKLLQIILVGQPELDQKLKMNELRQLRQRVAVYLHLEPLDKPDIKTYIHHRITIAASKKYQNSTPKIIFTEQAISAIYQYTQGTPRKINILCDRALLSGFISETHLIDDIIIENCAKEVLYCEHHL